MSLPSDSPKDNKDCHAGISVNCDLCQEVFPSKNKFFIHLEQRHGWVPPNAMVKIIITLGYMNVVEFEDDESLLIDSVALGKSELTNGEAQINHMITRLKVEFALFSVLRSLGYTGTKDPAANPVTTTAEKTTSIDEDRDNNMKELDALSVTDLYDRVEELKPKSYTRASQCLYTIAHPVGLEKTGHALADVASFFLIRHPGDEQDWLTEVNSKLPSYVNVLSCKIFSKAQSGFDAYKKCFQRHYNYLIPMKTVFPKSFKNYDANTQHLDDDAEEEENLPLEWIEKTLDDKRLILEADPSRMEQREISRQYAFELQQKEIEENKKTLMLDHLHCRDVFKGPNKEQNRLFFRLLKEIMKKMSSTKSRSFHNFISGGLCPRDSAAIRKISKFQLKEFIQGLSIDNQSDSETGEAWCVFSITGDGVLRGQFRKMLGLAIACARGWLPIEYIDFALPNDYDSPDYLLDVPSVPGVGLYLFESSYSVHESKFPQYKTIDPRRAMLSSDASDSDRINLNRLQDWKKKLHYHVMTMMMKDLNGNGGDQAGQRLLGNSTDKLGYCDWERRTKEKCILLNQQFQAICALKNRSLETPQSCESFNHKNNDKDNNHTNGSLVNAKHPEMYSEVLRLLRQADRSGLWPKSSEARKQIILKKGDEQKASAKPKVKKNARKATKEKGKRNSSDSKKTSNKDKDNDNNDNNDNNNDIDELQRKSQSEPTTRTKNKRKNKKREVVVSDGNDLDESIKDDIDCNNRNLDDENNNDVHDHDHSSEIEGGTFSVGAFPFEMAQPKANSIFSELMVACFKLEREICPSRIPSSTIAINRNAQFTIHRDRGAGNGQSLSCIVGLGDYHGGEIGVEYDAHDIQYKPLEFDGWSQRHFTYPFEGERFSLVFFSPLGVEEKDCYWRHTLEWKTFEEKLAKKT